MAEETEEPEERREYRRFNAQEPGNYLDPVRRVLIDYTNWRGERAAREIVPLTLWFGSDTGRHDTPQWILTAWDCKKRARRHFALDKIHSWQPAPPETSDAG